MYSSVPVPVRTRIPVESHILFANVNSIYCELLFYVKLSETEYVLLYCVYWPVMSVYKYGYTSKFFT